MPETLCIITPPEAGDVLAAAIRTLDDVDPRRVLAALAAPNTGRSQDDGPAGRVAEACRGGALDGALVALAWLACGRAGHVRAILRELAGMLTAPTSSSPPALLPLLVARYVAWTGDLRTAIAAWPDVTSAALALAAPAESGRGAPGDTDGPGARATGSAAVAADPTDVATVAAVLVAGGVAGTERAATDLGDPQLAARLHARSRDLTAVVVERAVSGRAALLAAALDLPLPASPGDWAVRSDPRSPLQAPHGGAPELPADAAGDVLRAVHQLLGAAPDAARHRLWLRPRLPAAGADADRLEARSILVGDDSVSLVLERESDGLVARVEQEAGPIPLTVLLELYVPGPLRRAVVDGRDAGLAPRPAGAGLVVPVQLVLDHARTVELEF